MKKPEELKKLIRERYAAIATKGNNSTSPCCPSVSKDELLNMMSDEYQNLDGYCREADLGLGCGLPTEYAAIVEGDVVIDLGSGAGIDCFAARNLAGEKGQIIGIDFTPEMVEKARHNAFKSGFDNVEFLEGDIENLPVKNNIADVVISNCVLNLVPDKNRAFSEIIRVLKAGGHFCVSDIVLKGELPEKIREAANMYSGCISGALQKEDYFKIVERAGFTNLALRKEKEIVLPDEIMSQYLNDDEIKMFRSSGTGIFSITITGMKPSAIGCGCGCTW